MSWLRAWILACRMRTLAAAVVPVAVGSSVAYRSGAFRSGGFCWDIALFILMAAMLIQIGTNLANDVFDFEQGADTKDRVGPTRAVASGSLTAQQVYRGMGLVFGLAMLAGAYLVWLRGLGVMLIGLSSIAAGIGYTRGKRSLAYIGLGDVFVFTFFGLVAVVGTEWVETQHWDMLAVWSGVPVGALATVLLAVNNLRDRKTDAQAGKRTLIVRFGPRFAVGEITALLLVAHLVPVLLVGVGMISPAVLITLLLVPLSVRIVRDALSQDGRALNQTLARSARLLMIYGLVFAAALNVSG